MSKYSEPKERDAAVRDGLIDVDACDNGNEDDPSMHDGWMPNWGDVFQGEPA